MNSLLILLVGLFLLTLCCGAVGSFFIFLFDVIRWHRAEKRVIVSASAQELPDKLTKEVNSDERDNNRSFDRSSDRGADRSPNGTDAGSSDGDCDRDSGSSSDSGTESRESDSRSIFDSWLQP